MADDELAQVDGPNHTFDRSKTHRFSQIRAARLAQLRQQGGAGSPDNAEEQDQKR